MYPVLFQIPNAYSMMSSGARRLELLVGAACLVGWIAMAARGRRNALVSTLNMGAFLVALHMILSWLMPERGPDGELAQTPITIFSFGVVIILAFFAATAYMLRQTRPLHIADKKIFDWAFWMLVVGILGSRLLYAFLNYDHFVHNKAEIFKIWHGGLVWYGGLVPAALVGVYLLRKHKLPVLHVADIGAAAVMLALGLGRWACLLAGDDYGRPTDAWFGIRFYDSQSLVPEGLRGQALHPSQMYMSLMCLWIFFGVETIRRRGRFGGQALAWMLILYAVGRGVLIEPIRGDFVERNPAWGRHLAVALVFDKPEGSGPVHLERGAAVAGVAGRTGRLLAKLDLTAGQAQGVVYAITDEPVESVGGAAVNWKVISVEGLAEGVEFRSDASLRRRNGRPNPYYDSDLPVPPGYVSTSQWISLLIVIAGAALLYCVRRWKVAGYRQAVAAT